MEMKKLSYLSAVFGVWDNFGVEVSGLNSWGGREQVVWVGVFYICSLSKVCILWCFVV